MSPSKVRISSNNITIYRGVSSNSGGAECSECLNQGFPIPLEYSIPSGEYGVSGSIFQVATSSITIFGVPIIPFGFLQPIGTVDINIQAVIDFQRKLNVVPESVTCIVRKWFLSTIERSCGNRICSGRIVPVANPFNTMVLNISESVLYDINGGRSKLPAQTLQVRNWTFL